MQPDEQQRAEQMPPQFQTPPQPVNTPPVASVPEQQYPQNLPQNLPPHQPPQAQVAIQPEAAPTNVTVQPIEAEQTAQPQQSYGVQPVQWQAPEYVQDLRSPKWFIGFWVVAILLMVAAFFLLQSWSFALLIPAMAAALMIYSHRPPRFMSYVVSDKGLYINEKLHPMTEFKAFGIARDESIPSLVLIPVKRFRPALTIHFPAEVGEILVDTLGRVIPMQEIKPDAFDKIIRKLHI